MDDVLHAVDLDRRPVGPHGGDLAAGDAPQQTGAVQVIQRARWMTSEQGQRIPAEVGGTLSPAAAAMFSLRQTGIELSEAVS
jgi:acetyl-CoA acetyltransferase